MTGPLDWPGFRTKLQTLAAAAGFTERLLVETAAGPLSAWHRGGRGPRIYLSAGIHGDEPAGPLALLDLLESGYFDDRASWSLCPLLNPTGLAAASRESGAGIDLNRDYWIRSSPEVVAHAAWLEEIEPPNLFISLHEDWETSGFYFYEINLGADRPERAARILEAAGRWFPPEPGPEIDGHDVRSAGWIYHAAEPDLPEGWPEAIFLAKRGCPLSFTFETPSRGALVARVAAHSAAVKAACGMLID